MHFYIHIFDAVKFRDSSLNVSQNPLRPLLGSGEITILSVLLLSYPLASPNSHPAYSCELILQDQAVSGFKVAIMDKDVKFISKC